MRSTSSSTPPPGERGASRAARAPGQPAWGRAVQGACCLRAAPRGPTCWKSRWSPLLGVAAAREAGRGRSPGAGEVAETRLPAPRAENPLLGEHPRKPRPSRPTRPAAAVDASLLDAFGKDHRASAAAPRHDQARHAAGSRAGARVCCRGGAGERDEAAALQQPGQGSAQLGIMRTSAMPGLMRSLSPPRHQANGERAARFALEAACGNSPSPPRPLLAHRERAHPALPDLHEGPANPRAMAGVLAPRLQDRLSTARQGTSSDVKIAGRRARASSVGFGVAFLPPFGDGGAERRA